MNFYVMYNYLQTCKLSTDKSSIKTFTRRTLNVTLKPASSIFLNFPNTNILDRRQILKQDLHSPNCYTKQVVQLIRHSVDLALHQTASSAKKYYALRNLRNIQAEAKNCVSHKKTCKNICFLSRRNWAN